MNRSSGTVFFTDDLQWDGGAAMRGRYPTHSEWMSEVKVHGKSSKKRTYRSEPASPYVPVGHRLCDDQRNSVRGTNRDAVASVIFFDQMEFTWHHGEPGAIDLMAFGVTAHLIHTEIVERITPEGGLFSSVRSDDGAEIR